MFMARHPVGPAEELFQPVVAELPRQIPKPEHVLEKRVQGVFPLAVVAGDCAELCFCGVGYQPPAENLCTFRPGAGPQPLVPRLELLGSLLYRLVVVWSGQLRVGAANVHVYRGLPRASAEEARLGEDGHAREPFLPDAEPALHRCVAVPGLQDLVVNGCRGEVLGVARAPTRIAGSRGAKKGGGASTCGCVVPTGPRHQASAW